MNKQHFTTEVAHLLNPPLPSKYRQLQLDSLEEIYASKKYPLGRTHSPDIPYDAIRTRFGIPTEKGDSADVLIYPFNCRVCHTLYTDEFYPPNLMKCEVLPAGIKIESHDSSGKQMKEVFDEIGSGEPTVIVPISSHLKKKLKEKQKVKHESFNNLISCDDDHCGLTISNQAKIANEGNLLVALWNLVKTKHLCRWKNFTSFLRSYLQNFSKTFTLSDLQKMLENLDVTVSKHTLKLILSSYGVIDNSENINYDAFLKALKWDSMLGETFKAKKSKCIVNRRNINYPCDDSVELYKTTASVIGDHKSVVPPRTAGIPSLQNEVTKSKLNAGTIIQPSVFEKYGIYEEDLGALRTKQEIKSILFKSGISFRDGSFNMVWDSFNENGKASIGKIWNGLKQLCLSKNNLFS